MGPPQHHNGVSPAARVKTSAAGLSQERGKEEGGALCICYSSPGYSAELLASNRNWPFHARDPDIIKNFSNLYQHNEIDRDYYMDGQDGMMESTWG